MKTKKRVLPALVFSLFASFAAPDTQAAQFSGVYVFGDSLSDAGYYRGFLASLGLPAPVVAQLGRFTTNPGPVWSEIVTQYYGFAPAPSNVTGGNIFAQGGARVASSSTATPPNAAQRPVSTQIGEYLARTGGTADPGCTSATDTNEHDSSLECDDGIDNDNDGLVDLYVTALGKKATTLPFLPMTYLLKFHAGRWPLAPR